MPKEPSKAEVNKKSQQDDRELQLYQIKLMHPMLKRAQIIVDESSSKAQQDDRELQLYQIKLLSEILSALWRLEERK